MIGSMVGAFPYLTASVFDGSSIGAPDNSVEPYDRKSDDASYSWHGPDALFDSGSGSFVYGAVQAADGNQVVITTNGSGVETSRDTVNTGLAFDDHNAPVPYKFDDVLYIGINPHNDSDIIKVQVSTDMTAANLGASTSIDLGVSATYVQFADCDGTLWLTSRAADLEWVMYELVAGTWTARNSITSHTSQCYINLRPFGTLAHAVAWVHPINGGADRGKIYTREFTPNDAELALSSWGVIYTPGAGKSTRVLDTTADGNSIVFAEFTVGTYTGQEYFVLKYNGSGAWDAEANWTKTKLGDTDHAFFESSNYVSGAAFASEDGTSCWVIETTSGGVSSMYLATFNGTSWSKGTAKAVSNTPLARPICDPARPEVAITQRVSSYPGFDNAGTVIDAYPIYSNDSIVDGDFTAPVPPVVGVRHSEEFEEFGDDVNPYNIAVDGSLAEVGDTVTALITHYKSTGVGFADLTYGGQPMTRVASSRPDFSSEPESPSATSFWTRVIDGSEDATGLSHDAPLDTPSFQRGIFAIVTPDFGTPVSYEQTGDSYSITGVAWSAGDLLFGAMLTASDAASPHVYTPDARVSKVGRGTGSAIVISHALGVATDSGTGGGVTGTGTAGRQSGLYTVWPAT